jgi:hypothetical protein
MPEAFCWETAFTFSSSSARASLQRLGYKPTWRFEKSIVPVSISYVAVFCAEFICTTREKVAPSYSATKAAQLRFYVWMKTARHRTAFG